MSLNPLATYDCLYFASRLQRQIGGFTAAELHLLSYLACLLGLYRAQPQTDWGYGFVGTELGAPFSTSIDGAVRALTGWGYFTSLHDHLQIAPVAESRLSDLTGHELYFDRTECLKASAASVLAFSVGTVREALGQQPELHRAKIVPGSRVLLEDSALADLYENFHVLREALGDEVKDLRLPAVAWITALFQNSQRESLTTT